MEPGPWDRGRGRAGDSDGAGVHPEIMPFFLRARHRKNLQMNRNNPRGLRKETAPARLLQAPEWRESRQAAGVEMHGVAVADAGACGGNQE